MPAAESTPSWQRAHGAGPVLSYRAPFSLDTIIWLLNRTLFKPQSIVLLPLVAWAHGVYTGDILRPSLAAGGTGATLLDTAAALLDQVRGAVTSHNWLRRLWFFVVYLNAHRAATRYVKNLGHYARDPTDFRREVIVITGGSAGIGRAIVELLSHKHKAKVAVLDMAPPTYAPAPKGAPEILYIKTDVSSHDAVRAAAEQITRTFGIEPTVLINNAGIVSSGTILDTNTDAVQRVWRVNALAHYVTLQQFLPNMIRRAHGHVISVASSASYFSLPELSTYATSKSAAMSIHECLTGELRARYGPNARRIRTTVVAPTKVSTALGAGLESQRNQFTSPTLEPIQVAERVVQTLENGLSDHIIMPALMNILPVVTRGPAWLRRLIELIGDTDYNVTDKGLQRAIKGGYGASFTNDEDKAMWNAALSRSKAVA